MTQSAAIGRGPPEDLCLAFSNTRYWRGTDTPTEELQAPTDLLRWCTASSGLDAATLAKVGAHWAADPAAAAAALNGAITLREAVYRIFAAVSGETPVADADVTILNAALAAAVPRSCLLPARLLPARLLPAWGWALPARAPELATLLAPVLWSAGDLLAGGRLGRVRRCANPHCVYLFLDDSKAATRRWCAMSACGNRAKAHRHYAKLKAGRAG